jgi:Mg-chelatase subunit ChlI
LDAPNTVFAQHLVYEIGLKTSTSGWLIQSAQPLIAAQIHNAQAAAAAAAAAAARLALAGRSSCGMADGSSHILLPLRLRRARLNQRSPASGGFSARH